MSDYKTVVDGKKRIIRNPEINTDNDFIGKYRGFYIEIALQDTRDEFYIKVYNPEVSFGTIYDGVFTEDDHFIRCVKAGTEITPFNIDCAIQDAIRNILI